MLEIVNEKKEIRNLFSNHWHQIYRNRHPLNLSIVYDIHNLYVDVFNKRIVRSTPRLPYLGWILKIN